MPHRNVYHVVPHDDGWAVRLEGSPTASATTDSRGDAIEAATGFLRLLGDGRVVVHDDDGRIESGFSLASIPSRETRRRWTLAVGVLGGAFLVGLAVAAARRR